MKKNNLEWISYCLLAVGIILPIVCYPFLPDVIPVHWNIDGAIDGYGPKYIVLIAIPIVMLMVYLLLRWIPKIDPKRKNYENFDRTYMWFRMIVMTMLVLVEITTIAATFGLPIDIGIAMRIIIGVMFLFMGNLMPKVQQTYFVGIKTPWTLANETVWRKTHQLAGKIWVGGAIVIILTVFIPNIVIGVIVMISAIVIMVVWPIVYSYLLYKKIN